MRETWTARMWRGQTIRTRSDVVRTEHIPHPPAALTYTLAVLRWSLWAAGMIVWGAVYIPAAGVALAALVLGALLAGSWGLRGGRGARRPRRAAVVPVLAAELAALGHRPGAPVLAAAALPLVLGRRPGRQRGQGHRRPPQHLRAPPAVGLPRRARRRPARPTVRRDHPRHPGRADRRAGQRVVRPRGPRPAPPVATRLGAAARGLPRRPRRRPRHRRRSDRLPVARCRALRGRPALVAAADGHPHPDRRADRRREVRPGRGHRQGAVPRDPRRPGPADRDRPQGRHGVPHVLRAVLHARLRHRRRPGRRPRSRRRPHGRTRQRVRRPDTQAAAPHHRRGRST